MCRYLLTFFLLFCCAEAWAAEEEGAPDTQPSSVPGYSMGDLRKLMEAQVRTGVNTDAIPALHRPQYVSVSDASLSMDDNEAVFVVQDPEGRTRIYPQRIMVWHEVVNDVLPDSDGRMPERRAPLTAEAAGRSYTITYSPLSGVVTAFRSRVGKYPTAFGVSGTLLNGNSVLYDTISRSQWCQLMAVCIDGPFKGKRLERVPVVWATWKGAKERWLGKAEVLSRSTGYKRNYGKDPYGSYQVRGSYYDNARLIYAVSRLDGRLPLKKRILGLEHEALFAALQVDEVRARGVYNFSLGVVPLVAFYDARIDAVRVFDRRVEGSQPLSFKVFEGKYVDEQTQSEWTPEGQGVYGRYRDKPLTPVLAVDAMWYAWAAFYKDTQIFPPLNVVSAP